MKQATLIKDLRDLGIPRNQYWIGEFETCPPGDNSLGICKSGDNPYRIPLWETFGVERGKKCFVHYFKSEDAAVAMLAWMVLESNFGMRSSPIATGLHVFFSMFMDRTMSINQVELDFESQNHLGPATISGSCGRFHAIVRCFSSQIDIRLSTTRNCSPEGNFVVMASGKNWEDCSKDWLPICRTIIANHIPEDRFAGL